MTYDPQHPLQPSRTLPATVPPYRDDYPSPAAPVVTQRLEHDHHLDAVVDATPTRDQTIRMTALQQAVASLPPSYGQHEIVLTIAAAYEQYIRNGGKTP